VCVCVVCVRAHCLRALPSAKQETINCLASLQKGEEKIVPSSPGWWLSG